MTDEEKVELQHIMREMADLGQAFEMVNDLPLILETQERLLVLMKEVNEMYEQKKASV